MFDVGIEKIALLLVFALIIFGPEELPKIVSQAARTLRQLRRLATDATDELKAGLGPEYADLEFADLNPRRLITKHLLTDPDDDSDISAPTRPHVSAGRAPFDSDAT
jgi:sec-independent protein translocase protein TatB